MYVVKYWAEKADKFDKYIVCRQAGRLHYAPNGAPDFLPEGEVEREADCIDTGTIQVIGVGEPCLGLVLKPEVMMKVDGCLVASGEVLWCVDEEHGECIIAPDFGCPLYSQLPE